MQTTLLFLFLVATTVLSAQNLMLVKGVVTDSKTDKPLGVDISIYEFKTTNHVASFNSNVETGKYLISLPAGRRYTVTFKKQGYIDAKENFNCTRLKGYKEVQKDIDMPLSPDQLIDNIKKGDVKNVQFGN